MKLKKKIVLLGLIFYESSICMKSEIPVWETKIDILMREVVDLMTILQNPHRYTDPQTKSQEILEMEKILLILHLLKKQFEILNVHCEELILLRAKIEKILTKCPSYEAIQLIDKEKQTIADQLVVVISLYGNIIKADTTIMGRIFKNDKSVSAIEDLTRKLYENELNQEEYDEKLKIIILQSTKYNNSYRNEEIRIIIEMIIEFPIMMEYKSKYNIPTIKS